MKKRIVAVFMSLCMMFVSMICVSAEELHVPQDDQILQEKDELFMERQGESLTTYFAVKDELSEDKETYGGVYIDDNGDLNIMIVNSSPVELQETASAENNRYVKDYQNIVADQRSEDQNIVYHLVNYSLDYLKSVQNTLMNNSDEFEILSSYIDESQNTIVVGYSSDTFNKQNVLDFVGENEMIVFTEVDEPQLDSSNLTLRNGTGVRSDSSDFTIACGAKLGNDYGFITAGHCGDVGTRVYYKTEYIGTITKSVFAGNTDAAFIKRSSASTKSTTEFTDGTAYKAGMSNYGNGALNVIGSWPTGTSVVAYGSKTVKSSGQIKSTSYSVNYKKVNVKLSNMVLATCKSQAGDSGGAVKATIRHNGLTTVYLSGIISGHSNDELVYTDIDNAKISLGCVGYYDTNNVK